MFVVSCLCFRVCLFACMNVCLVVRSFVCLCVFVCCLLLVSFVLVTWLAGMLSACLVSWFDWLSVWFSAFHYSCDLLVNLMASLFLIH